MLGWKFPLELRQSVAGNATIRQISEEMQQENEVNSQKLLMRRLLAVETRAGVGLMTQEKESRLGGSRLRCLNRATEEM